MRIMTSNIWADTVGNEAAVRDELLVKVYEKYTPDVIGFQEVSPGWYESCLFEKLSREYTIVGAQYLGINNYVPIALKKKYSVIALGFEYLEQTPSQSKSICWVVAESDGSKFALCNVHFWNMKGTEKEELKKKLENRFGKVAYFTKEEHDHLRVQNAEQTVSIMNRLHQKYQCPVFLTGDMNTNRSAEIFRVYEENYIENLFDLAVEKDMVCSYHGYPIRGTDNRFHGNKTTKDYTASIDHILGMGLQGAVKKYCIVEDQDALDATDHSPVFAEIE